ncbi:DUF6544 family protein [Sulfitobacter sp. S190]|uniref:DUF6544 family protein n=1 Tax=Sulfitobacter sp. S190 TaxID=2867022 RepID=UPI0021FF674C|nr:DUF6544 family protein [Sulfitobacter sp. S190]UWR21846.1 hypothetical protein K3756_14320 [Sulfitobacter sp. S190]
MRFVVFFTVLVLGVSCLALLRAVDHRADRREIARLLALQPRAPAVFDHSMITGLPEPAQRFFRFAIAEGTALFTVADIRMSGKFSLGTAQRPNYMRMEGRQVLAAPEGFVWQVKMRSGHLRLSGSDSGEWTRFRMGGLLPVARQGGTADHARSAFGRYVAEAVFWTPAAVLPGPGVVWTELGQNAARLTMTYREMSQSLDLTVGADGRPIQIVFPRWSNANPDKSYQLQSFGGTLENFKEFQGFTLPTRVEAGNFFGSDNYFAFYIADVEQILFPHAAN